MVDQQGREGGNKTMVPSAVSLLVGNSRGSKVVSPIHSLSLQRKRVDNNLHNLSIAHLEMERVGRQAASPLVLHRRMRMSSRATIRCRDLKEDV
jgi:hypothetical protein